MNDKAPFDNEDNDLRINTWATTAQLLWKRKGNSEGLKRPTREDLEAFETTYNAACASIAMGDIRQGEHLLKRAKGRQLGTRRHDGIINGCRIMQDIR